MGGGYQLLNTLVCLKQISDSAHPELHSSILPMNECVFNNQLLFIWHMAVWVNLTDMYLGTLIETTTLETQSFIRD